MYIPEEVTRIADYIRTMRIRGAGRIARAAAQAMKIAALHHRCSSYEEYIVYIRYVAEMLLSTRPTAVSLPNAVKFILNKVLSSKTLDEAVQTTVRSAEDFIQSSLNAVALIGSIGSRLIEDGDVLLTHCNSSAALAVIKAAHLEGKQIKVYATETRPRFQGLISYENLKKAGVDVTLIVDSAVRYFMKDVDKVIVGADAIAANGAVVNKVGTSLIALAAHEARVRFYVAAETYKFSPATFLGELVVIEERDATEVVPRQLLGRLGRVKVRNPAFDVTPPEYIDAIITEKGLIPPKASILILEEEYGRTLEEELTKLTLDIDDSEYVAVS